MRIGKPRDFATGILFIVIGGAFALHAGNYNIGRAAEMGPGYLPLLLGSLLALLGILLIGTSLKGSGPRIELRNPRALITILAGVLVFTVLLRPTGLFIATAVLVAIVSFASAETSWRETAVLSVALAGAAILIFVYALGLPLQALPPHGFL